MERMKAPKVPESPVPVISADEFRKLLKTTVGHDYNDRRDAAILLLMYDSGIRRGEVAGLRLWLTLRARVATPVRSGSERRPQWRSTDISDSGAPTLAATTRACERRASVDGPRPPRRQPIARRCPGGCERRPRGVRRAPSGGRRKGAQGRRDGT
jgi:hypothetical protein